MSFVNAKSQKPYPSETDTEQNLSTSKRVTVYIITGFLGAGKTTLLNHLLRQFGQKDNFIIENEFGKVNIDKELVQGNIQKVFEITDGCLCCNLDTDLYDALDQIARLEKKPDNLFVETTGIADAGNLSAIFREEFVAEVFDLKKIICVADTEVIEDFLTKATEAGRQIAASDIVLLNKANKVGASELQRLESLVKNINPWARYLPSNDGSIDASYLAEPPMQKPAFSVDRLKENHFAHNITSVLYETQSCFDIEKLEVILRTSLFIYYQDVYRIKGFVKDCFGKTYLLQSAGKTLSVSQWNESVPHSQLVFIGRKLTPEIAERLLQPTLI